MIFFLFSSNHLSYERTLTINSRYIIIADEQILSTYGSQYTVPSSFFAVAPFVLWSLWFRFSDRRERGMGREPMDLAAAVALLLLLCFGIAGVASDASNHRYKKGDSVPLYANKVGPFHNPRWGLYSFSQSTCSDVRSLGFRFLRAMMRSFICFSEIRIAGRWSALNSFRWLENYVKLKEILVISCERSVVYVRIP